jgi:hypothetical protein
MAAISAAVPIVLPVPFPYQRLWLLAGILFLTNGGEAMAALVIVLLSTESVPAGLAATAIGLVTVSGELIRATLMPSIAASLANRYGQACRSDWRQEAPLWYSLPRSG